MPQMANMPWMFFYFLVFFTQMYLNTNISFLMTKPLKTK